LPDERYFELKYNINLLKAVSAILIFLLGFLGFTTYNDITDIVEGDFEEKFNIQEEKIKALDSIVKNYENIVESLKSAEGESIENLNDVKREFGIINRKVSQTQESLKYTTKVFVIRDLKFPIAKFAANSRGEAFRVDFEKLVTIHGERLPKFKSKPLVMLQGKSIQLDLAEATKEYIRIGSSMTYDYGSEDPKYYYFDLWIAEPN
jgi:hypothetical protein